MSENATKTACMIASYSERTAGFILMSWHCCVHLAGVSASVRMHADLVAARWRSDTAAVSGTTCATDLLRRSMLARDGSVT